MTLRNDLGITNDRTEASVQTGTFRLNEDGVQPLVRPPTKGLLSVIRSRADLGVHSFVSGPTVLGRDPSCTITLHDHSVSRQHVKIEPRGDDVYVIEDLNSTNGTRINGVPLVAPQVLRDGEKIFVGDTVLRFSLADEMDVDFHSELATLLSTDPLTGLESKRRFDEALEFALRTATSSNGLLSVMMMDMDGVKQINDKHGHLFGAHVIGETGRIIARELGTRGRACRFGGDEFSAFIPGASLTSALAIAEQIRSRVETAGMEKDGIPLAPTISIGVACYPEAGSESLELVSKADEALYRAKDDGKNCIST